MSLRWRILLGSSGIKLSHIYISVVGLLTAVLVILLLGAVIFAYFKIRKTRFTELKGGEDDFTDGFSGGATNNFVDEPLSRSRNDVEIVKIS